MKVQLILAISDVKSFIPSVKKIIQEPLSGPINDEQELYEDTEDAFLNVWDDDEDVMDVTVE